MQRRRLLLGLGTAGVAAGALGAAAVRRSRASHTVAVADQDSVPPRVEMDLSIDVRRPGVTHDSPPVLELTVANRGDRRALAMDGDEALFDLHDRTPTSADALLLAPPQHGRGSVDGDGRWSHDGHWGDTAEYNPPAAVPPGETASERYRVWDHAGHDGYYPPGEWRFETTVDVYDSEGIGGTVVDRFEWGFSLRVTRK